MSQICDELREAIRTSNKSRYRLSRETKIDEGQLSRFMARGIGLSHDNIEKLFEALGFEIIIRKKVYRRTRK